MTTATSDAPIAAKGYAHPDALVSTEWLAEHLDDPSIVIVESDEDVLLYETGHIPGAMKIDWQIARRRGQVEKIRNARERAKAMRAETKKAQVRARVRQDRDSHRPRAREHEHAFLVDAGVHLQLS